MSLVPSHNRVLVVDDNPTALKLIRAIGQKGGYDILTANSAAQAKEILTQNGLQNFNAILTDYRMPQENGLELYLWIRERDPTLGALLMTAEGEKQLITESLRAGIFDFLEKPIERELLYASLDRCMEFTKGQRSLNEIKTSVDEIASVQQFISGVSIATGTEVNAIWKNIEVWFYPKHQAGGDFIKVFPLDSERIMILTADVSGHDLRAGFISAYFQGVFSGMMEKKANPEEIHDFFNKHLLNEWKGEATGGIAPSISVCTSILPANGDHLEILNNGFPQPLLIEASGRCSWLGMGTSPLGWFEDHGVKPFIADVKGGGDIYFFSDGVSDYAASIDMPTPAFIYRMAHLSDADRRLLLSTAADDVMVVRASIGETLHGFEPLLFEEYSGDSAPQIDFLQDAWRRAILFSIPDFPEPTLYDILLVTREGVLNAVNHGCNGRADLTCQFHMVYNHKKRLLRIRMEDPGPGYPDDVLDRHEEGVSEEHCGVFLMKQLATRMARENNGATLILDFELQPEGITI